MRSFTSAKPHRHSPTMMLSTTGEAPPLFSLTGTHLHRGSPASSLALTGGWPLRSLAAQAPGHSCPRLNDVPIGAHLVPQYINTIGTGTIGGKPIDSRPHRPKASSTQGPIGARPIGTSFSPLASALTAPRPTQLRPLGSALAAQHSRLGSLIGSALAAQPSRPNALSLAPFGSALFG